MLAPPEGYKGDSVPSFFLTSGGLLAILAFLCLQIIALIFTWGSHCVFVQIFPFYKNISHTPV